MPKPTPPRFVNAQSTAVGVYTADRRKIYVQPYADHATPIAGGVYVVEGAHYLTQVAPGGPLAHFPEADAALVPEAAPVVPVGETVVPDLEAGASSAKDATGALGASPAGLSTVGAGSAEDAGADLAGADEGRAADAETGSDLPTVDLEGSDDAGADEDEGDEDAITGTPATGGPKKTARRGRNR